MVASDAEVTSSERPSSTVWAVVLAAGASTRFDGLKQFSDLNGTTVVDRAVRHASKAADGVVLVVPRGCELRVRAGADAVVAGGQTRSASVRQGLAALPDSVDIIVIHDAAHPLASVELFRAVIDAVRCGADAAVPGVPVVEALRRVEGGRMQEDLDRSGTVFVQMPQAFQAHELRRLHADAPETVEDSILVWQSGGRVRVVRGEPANVHVATRADLELVRAIDRGRR